MTNMALMLVSALRDSLSFYGRELSDQVKNQILQKESTEARFANLKEQLNPHFLFNSLSTLNGLIDESQSSQEICTYMCDVYRYVLKNENVDKVTLRKKWNMRRSIYP